MATLVCFHAHPDDESIATGGTIARAADEGHRVVLVFATRGECGEVPDGFLDDGEELGHRRERETVASAAALGAHRVEFLGYRDSGMMGEPTNEDPACFWAADVEEAAERLARILGEEQADALTVYDDHGGYGHPDHIQVHRVGHRAAELAGTPRVYESTMNRDHLHRLMAEAQGSGVEIDDDVRDDSFGSPASIITTTVDVRHWVERKRESMRLHASQIAEESFFLAMAPDAFTEVFGWEWYIRTAGGPVGDDDWLLPG
ncbi:MAG TPA: PIG-L family deacetylase [Acidimicrobiales bacterium]|nr:PIG-L family deacetylase [Acidimicrobiales bacterium]